MKMKSTFKKKILPIILLVFLWGIALLVQFTSERPTSTSDSYLPKNYNFLAKIGVDTEENAPSSVRQVTNRDRIEIMK